jgi:hypothetical protein
MTGDSNGAQLRDQGIADALAADKAINRDYAADLWDALDSVIASGREFCADDLRKELPAGVRESLPPNLVGAVIKTASARGEIVPVGFVTSGRARRRAGVMRLWRPATTTTDQEAA